jgi:hypothetical protein
MPDIALVSVESKTNHRSRSNSTIARNNLRRANNSKVLTTNDSMIRTSRSSIRDRSQETSVKQEDRRMGKRGPTRTLCVCLFLHCQRSNSLSLTRQSKLLDWIPQQQTFLDELLRHDGHGDYLGSTTCSKCDEDSCTLFKCKDCWAGAQLCCRDCLISAHADLPLHRIEVSCCSDLLIRSTLRGVCTF